MKFAPILPRRLLRLLRDGCDKLLGGESGVPGSQSTQDATTQINERLAIAAETAGLGIWEWDLQSKVLTWDVQMYRLAGRAADAGEPAQPILLASLHPGDRERLESDLRIAIVCKSPFGGDYRLVWHNKEVRHVRVAARTILGPDNRVARLTGVAFDITALKEAQEAQTASEFFLDRVGRVAGVGGWRVDLRKQRIYWSKVTRVIHEVSDEFEPQLDEAINFYAPEARPIIENAVQEGITKGVPWDLELQLITAKGRRIWVRAVGEAEFAEGQAVALVGAFQDITERKTRDDELRLLEASIARINDSIVITKADVAQENGLEIVFVNPAFEKTTGFPESEILGKTPRVLQGPGTDRAELARIKSALLLGEPVRAELLNYTKNLVPYWIEVDISPIKAGSGEITHFVAVERDITERRLREQALQDAVQTAEQATAAKGQFLATMSHEIRTPMNAIIGMLTLLHNTELTPQQQDYAEKTHNAAHSLLGLINDILDFSKAEAGKMTLDPQPFQLDRLMRDLAVILSANVGTKGIEVLYDIAPGVPPVLLADAMRLQQILVNLAGNAVKFTAQGQVVISIDVGQRSADGVTLQFAVQDSGIGIAPENQARIFAGFSQAEASTTRKFGGTGLGLAISKRLIEIMGGQLHLSSALGQGSTFSFALTFPLVDDVPPNLQAEPLLGIAPKRAMVIDDNPVARNLTARMVRAWGWPTDTACSGEEALQTINARLSDRSGGDGFPYDVVYLDWHMPGLDGWETAQRIRALAPATARAQLTIIMVTASSREALAQRTVEEQSTIDGFVVKPVTPSMLLDATVRPQATHTGLRKGERAPASKRRLRGLRILVVEDNLINQQVAEELLLSEGALVSLAANGQLGVEAVQAAKPQFDAVLMDLQMPVLDGFAATQMIRKTLPLAELPIIAMTANAMASDRDACLAAGMNEHVGKPFNMTQLVKTLLRFTRQPTPPEPGAASVVPQMTSTTLVGTASGLPTIAVAEALERMSGMQALYVRAAREFAQSLPAVVADFRHSAGADVPRAVRTMHTLKGTAATLGANALSALASRLEQLCQSNTDPQAMAEAASSLEALADSTTRALHQVAGQLEQTAPAPAVAALSEAHDLRSHLEAMQDLLAQSNLAALEKFSEIRPHLDALPQAHVCALEEALQNLDLEEAHRLCQPILERMRPT